MSVTVVTHKVFYRHYEHVVFGACLCRHPEIRFLTTAVASEMSYASGLQRQALFSIALVLYLFIMLINAALNFFLKRKKE